MKNSVIKSLAVICVVIFLFINKMNSQIIQFSQFYAIPTLLSPSFTGLTNGSRLALVYRDQWPSLPGSFITSGLSYDHYFSRVNSGFGLVLLRDQAGAGPLAYTSFATLYSFDFNIDKDWHIRPGVNFSYAQRSLNQYNLTFGDQLSMDGVNTPTSIEPPIDDLKPFLDAAASVMAYNDAFWGGVNFEHLLRPNESLKGVIARVPIKFNLYGGYRMMFSPRRSLFEESVTFAMLYRNQQFYDQLDLGLYYTKSPLVLGAWFRGLPVFSKHDEFKYNEIDAIILLVGYKVKSFSIGYSYDFTISTLMDHSGGSHEISIVYGFNRDLRLQRRQKRAPIPCPKF